jgi:hypothetical protein
MINIFDLYTDYLQVSLGQATATGLSKIVDNAVSHDQITRMLATKESDSKALWLDVKPLVRQHENINGCLIFDDSIAHKPYTDENDIVCWHYDHCKGINVKGINLLTTFYHTQTGEQPLRVPIAFDIIAKYEHSCDIKSKQVKRKSPLTKNELMRLQITIAIQNAVKFSYVLADSWFSSGENMKFIHEKRKYFIFDLKSNRLAIIGDRNKANWKNINQLDLQAFTPVRVWLKDVELEILLIKQVFINKDGSSGTRYLVSNNLNLTSDDFASIYKKRWSVEEYHKSFKQNTCMTKSPTRTVKTQCSHIFASIVSYVKLERYKFSTKLNHFALKSKIYLQAAKTALKELEKIKLQHAKFESLTNAAA